MGSGTLLPDSQRGAPAHWIESGRAAVLLDCGSGTLRTLAWLGRRWDAVTHLVLSHFHTDHMGELAPLLFALKHGLRRPRGEPLSLLGPPGLGERLQALSAAHGAFVLEPGFPLEIREIQPGSGWTDPGGDFHLQTLPTRHSEGSMAFRVEAPAGALGYTGDTGPLPELGTFLRGCQAVVAECSHPDGEGMDTHLTPSGLAALAGTACPDLLIPVHVYPPLDPEQLPDLLARAGYTGEVLPGRDGLAVRWEAGTVIVEEPPQGGLFSS
ncbi:MBL fold metallo-hydrolase [Gemmatimonadota bacterium]